MKQQRAFQVFISSPDDVRDLRDSVKMVIAEWDKKTKRFDVRVDPWAWEDDADNDYYSEGPQAAIDAHVDESDAVVAIFGSTLGSSLRDGESGTVHEVNRAIMRRASGAVPRILACFPAQPPTAMTQEEAAAWTDVAGFRKEIKGHVLYIEYRNAGELASKVEQQLGGMLLLEIRHQPVRHEEVLNVAYSVSAEAPLVRSEGVSELVGRIAVAFTYVDALPPSTGNKVDVTLQLTTNITSRAEVRTVSGVQLLVWGEKGESVRQIVYGRRMSDDAVVFEDVVLLPGQEQPCLEIVDLRANVQALGDLATIYAKVDAQPSQGAALRLWPLKNELVAVAYSFPAVTALVSEMRVHAVDGINQGVLRGEGAASFTNVLDVVAGFPGALKSRFGETDLNRGIDVPKVADVPPGFASQGTRFMTRFYGIPDGVRVFVSARNLPLKGSVRSGAQAQLIVANAVGNSGGFCPAQPTRDLLVDGQPVVEVSRDDPWAVWEVVETEPDHPDITNELQFGVAVVAEPNAASLGTCMVNCTLAPVSSVYTASADAPIPRFIDMGVGRDRPLFTVEP